jgi:hypothetical protein
MTPSAEETASTRLELAARFLPPLSLQEGEIIVLVLKPSGWLVAVLSLPVVLAALAVTAAAYLMARYRPESPDAAVVVSVAAAVALVRVTLACWQWMGRTYVLTNRRILAARGVLTSRSSIANLADIEQVEVRTLLPEWLVGAGSLVCLGRAARVSVVWATLAKPQEVLEVVQEYVRRARHGLTDTKKPQA